MFFNLLLDGQEGGAGSTPPSGGCGPMDYVMWAVLAVLVIALMVWMRFSNKKRAQQEQERRDSLKIGDTATTIGGIYGKVVAVNKQKGTFVLETGEEGSKSTMEFIQAALYNINPVLDDAEETSEEENQETEEVSAEEQEKTEE